MISTAVLSILGSVVGSMVLLLLAGAGWLIRHERERREAVESQLSEKKYAAYMVLIDIFFESIKAQREGRQSPSDLPNRMLDANKDLLIYGADDVLLRYEELGKMNPRTEEEKLLLAHKFADLILAIRRDMGNANTRMTTDNVLSAFVKVADAQQQDAQAVGVQAVTSQRRIQS